MERDDASEPVGSPLLIACGSMPARIASRDAVHGRLRTLVEHTGLGLLLLTLAALLIRPGDIVPALAHTPIYETLIVCCVLVSAFRIARCLAWGNLRESPVTLLALFMPPMVITSHLWRGDTWSAQLAGGEAFKAGVLLLLIVAHVESLWKLRAVMAASAASMLVMVFLAVLNYHGLVRIPALANVVQAGTDEGAAPIVRLCGTGIFNDPNDLSLMLVVCLAVCGSVVTWKALGRRRWFAFIPMVVFLHALILTQSRGGFLAGAAAVVAFLGARYKWRNAVPVLIALGLLVLVPIWGRQTQWNVGNRDDTFQARLELWSSTLDEFRASPLFGVGQGQLVDRIGQVAHNSFLHVFAELGLLGGAAFIGAFALALRSAWKCGPAGGELARLRPYIVAVIAGYAAGLLSLTRCYTVPTQLVLALGAVYVRLCAAAGVVSLPRFDGRTTRFVAVVAAAFLAATYLFVRLMLSRG